MRTLPSWIASAPAVALALASLWLTVASVWGDGLWPAASVTLSEAVATRDPSEASRLIASGADPTRAALIRPGLLLDEPVTLTPLEVAVWTRNPAILTLLLDGSAGLRADTLRALRCLNEARPDADVRARLESLSDAPWPLCDSVALPGGLER